MGTAHCMHKSDVQPMVFSGVCGANHGGRNLHDFLHDEQRIQKPPLSTRHVLLSVPLYTLLLEW